WRPGLPGGEASALLTRALEAVPDDPTNAGYVWALASLGRALAFTGDADRARALGEQALAYARRLHDDSLLIHALQTMMWHDAAPDSVVRSVDAAAAWADELTGLARARDDWESVGT